MGWVMMSGRELNRVEVLAQVVDGRLTAESAATLLDMTRRQVFRLLKRFREDGRSGLRHKARGRPPNNRLHDAKRRFALDVIAESHAEFGPTLAAEMLADHHRLKVSRETLRKWMIEDGLWLSRKQRRTFHPPRLRRERQGELIQIDGSDHHWFEDRGPACTLLCSCPGLVDTHDRLSSQEKECPMESKKRRHFPDAFKREAVERALTSGLTITRVAEELGLHETVLRRWMRRFDPPGTGSARRPTTQAQGPSPVDLAAENARLKRELQKAQTERDILKKAALILGAATR